jgi:hypothetical protein
MKKRQVKQNIQKNRGIVVTKPESQAEKRFRNILKDGKLIRNIALWRAGLPQRRINTLQSF